MRIAAAIALSIFALTACVPWGGGEDCPYSEQADSAMYDWGNRQGKRLRQGEEALQHLEGADSEFEPNYQVGDIDVVDHFLGYSDGYFAGVMSAKFGHSIGGTSGDYPEVKAHVRGYLAGIKDSEEITAGFSNDEKAIFAEGFADAYIDSKDLCY